MKKVPTEKVPEVEEFLLSAERVKAFKEQHAKILGQLDALANDYNQKLEAAEKATRQLGVSCGPFDLFQVQVKYDAKALYESLGHDGFLAVGGTLSTQRVYDVDKSRIRVEIAANKIAEEVVKHFVSETNKYHKPEKIVLP